MTLALRSIFTFYQREMDKEVNIQNNPTGNTEETSTINWHSLPQHPENLPEMAEMARLFQHAANDLDRLKKAMALLCDEMKAEKQPEWLNSAEVLTMLRISKRTLQEYRDKKVIDFTKMGGRMHYSRKLVIGLLNKKN